MGRVLWTVRRGVHEFVQGIGYIAWHRQVDGACQVVPLEGEAAIEGAGPVGGDAVEGLEGVDEVLCVFFAYIFYPEVVDDKGEGDGSCGVAEETGCVGSGILSMESEVFLEVVVG